MEELKPICSSQDIVKLQQQVDTVYTSREVRAYISAIAAASRRNGALQLGVSTRAAISLLRAGQARALLMGRDYVSPEDIQKMAEPCWRTGWSEPRGAHAQHDGAARAWQHTRRRAGAVKAR